MLTVHEKFQPLPNQPSCLLYVERPGAAHAQSGAGTIGQDGCMTGFVYTQSTTSFRSDHTFHKVKYDKKLIEYICEEKYQSAWLYLLSQ